MFVPFSCHNTKGKFQNATEVRSCLIDRIRILKIIDRYGADEMLTKLSDFSKNCEGEFGLQMVSDVKEDIVRAEKA